MDECCPLVDAGKPLPAEDHTAQFGRVDPLVAAVTRTMGAQGVKPLSLELREEVRGRCWEAGARGRAPAGSSGESCGGAAVRDEPGLLRSFWDACHPQLLSYA